MTSNTQTQDVVTLPDAPEIPGLTFRNFRGHDDFPKMHAVGSASRAADGIEWSPTLEDIISNYSNLKNSDPSKDLLIAEVNGQVVAYSRVSWFNELDGTGIYSHFVLVDPAWRHKGIEQAVMHWAERRLREIAAEHPENTKQILEGGWIQESQSDMRQLLESHGYETVRHSYEMVRPDLENIPNHPFPDGIEVRPVTPEHYRAIYDAEVEAFKDHWGAWQDEEADYDRWLLPNSNFQPDIWQVAWDGDQVVGMVRNFIDHTENEKFNRKRGYTEAISVRRPWRKKGVAKALIAQSFRMHKDLGMEQAALGVDTENPNGALQLYESMGFKVVKNSAVYRKPLE